MHTCGMHGSYRFVLIHRLSPGSRCSITPGLINQTLSSISKVYLYS